MIALSSFSLHPGLEAILSWFFNESDGDLGLKSNYGAMISLWQMGSRAGRKHVNHEMDGRMVEIASRARFVSRLLEAAGKRHARILRAWLTPSPPALKEFGELAGVVLQVAEDAGFTGPDRYHAASNLLSLCQQNPRLRKQVVRDAEHLRREACKAITLAFQERSSCLPR